MKWNISLGGVLITLKGLISIFSKNLSIEDLRVARQSLIVDKLVAV